VIWRPEICPRTSRRALPGRAHPIDMLRILGTPDPRLMGLDDDEVVAWTIRERATMVDAALLMEARGLSPGASLPC